MKKNLEGNVCGMNTKKNKGVFGSEEGTAMVIALLVMILLMGFVALAVSRTNSETLAAANDAAESRTFEAANASLEIMTRNFSKIFDLKLNPDSADFTRIEGQKPPDFPDYDFPSQKITQTMTTQPVVMTGELFQGLNALRDEWKIDTSAVSKKDGVEVLLTRRFFNNRIPIFQFGIFYDDDLEFHPGPRFDFGGRVHSNGNIFLAASTGLYFASKVSAKGEILTNIQKNGAPYSDWGDNVHIKNASGTFIQLKNNMGSALSTPVNGSPVTSSPLPTTYKNSTWSTQQAKFQGNLLSNQKPMDLPVKLNSNITGSNLDYVELVKRGRNVGDLYNDGTGSASSPSVVAVTSATQDDEITSHERYYGKNGMRISLADSKAKLPGCATSTGAAVTTQCGIRLDGAADGLGSNGTGDDKGYQPRAMTGTPAYQATRLNGNRFAIPGREVWIKIETNGYDQPTNTYVTADITEDILAFGVTEAAPELKSGSTTYFSLGSAYHGGTAVDNGIDKRSIVKLQRFIMDGANMNAQTPTTDFVITDTTWPNLGTLKTPYNFSIAGNVPSGGNCATSTLTAMNDGNNPNTGNTYTKEKSHWKTATVRLAYSGAPANTTLKCVIPYPINMFDTREGLYYEGTSTFNPTSTSNYGKKVPWAGVMSMIDIDVANLREFLAGTYDTRMPAGTPWATANSRTIKSTDIRNANGWVLYVSDRRGDFDFDGEYDMEDVYGNNDGTLQAGEDVNKNNTLQADYTNEAVKYRGTGTSQEIDIAAFFDHKYYRRGVRLINGSKIPGKYDNTTPSNTRGFTFASENAVYVEGNYNATGVSSYGTPTPPTDYLPQNTVDHIPSSIAGDAVVILSNNWSDARSFVYPFDLANRPATETTLRFGTLTGDTLTSLEGTPNQGGGNPRMSGGVHNFIRFLEDWDNSVNLNYSGSLINMFNSRNNNGTFKCCSIIYAPPQRNWVFDTTFLDGNRLPPGTPFFQVIQLTGFQRLN